MMKKWIAYVLAALMVFSMGAGAMADEVALENETAYVQELIEETESAIEEAAFEDVTIEESTIEESTLEEVETIEEATEETIDEETIEETVAEETEETIEETTEAETETTDEATEAVEETTEAETEEETTEADKKAEEFFASFNAEGKTSEEIIESIAAFAKANAKEQEAAELFAEIARAAGFQVVAAKAVIDEKEHFVNLIQVDDDYYYVDIDCDAVLVGTDTFAEIHEEEFIAEEELKGEISKEDYKDKMALLEAIRFSDVTDPSSPFYEPIYWAANKGIVTGYSDGRFGPGDTCTRKQFAIMLYRLAGKPAVSGSMPFPDCRYSSTSDSYKAILWAYKKGIVDGYSDGKFKPNNNVTRKQAMIMLYRYAGAPMVAGTLKFTDCTGNSRNSATYKAILWGVNNGITNGTSATKFSPDNNCLRRQIVYFMYKMVNSGTAFKDDPKAVQWENAKKAYLKALDTYSTGGIYANTRMTNGSVTFYDIDGNGIKEMLIAVSEDDMGFNITCKIFTYRDGKLVNMWADGEGPWMGFAPNGMRHTYFTLKGEKNAIYDKSGTVSGGVTSDVIDRYVIKNGTIYFDKTIVTKYREWTEYTYSVGGKASTEKAANDKLEEILGNIDGILLGDFVMCMKAPGYKFDTRDFTKYYKAIGSYNGAYYYLWDDNTYPTVR